MNSEQRTGFRSADRVQESLLSPLERRALLWMAARLPARVNSDHLTLLGFGSMILGGVFYAFSGREPLLLHAVNACLLLNWFGDSLDGTVARVRNRQRPRYGFYVDHIVDSFNTLCLIGGLALSGFMSERVSFAVLTAFLLLSINSYLLTHVLGKFQISFFKFSPTELRILLVVANLVILRNPNVTLWGQSYLLYDVGGLIGAGIMGAVLIISAAWNTRRLYLMERL